MVRAKEDHADVLSNVVGCAEQLGLTVQGITHSPIKGPAGNIEFLMHLSRDKNAEVSTNTDPFSVVTLAHEILNAE